MKIQSIYAQEPMSPNYKTLVYFLLHLEINDFQWNGELFLSKFT